MRLVEAEKVRRRQARLKQVRKQASRSARRIRSEVKSEEKKMLDELALNQLRLFRESKRLELEALEEEYKSCLEDMGRGQQAAEEHQRSIEVKEPVVKQG